MIHVEGSVDPLRDIETINLELIFSDIEILERRIAKTAKSTAANNSEVFVICAQIEQEIAELDDDEKKEFLDAMGLAESGLDKLIAASYRLLGLTSYLTSGEDETRAWTIKVGTKAPRAAGRIHSDFERGFIRAEVVNYQDLLDCQTYAKAKEKGLVGIEGKEYVVKDGDVILFRFNSSFICGLFSEKSNVLSRFFFQIPINTD